MHPFSTPEWPIARPVHLRPTVSRDGAPAPTAGPRWRLDDIDFSRLDHARIADNEALFYLLISASFVESGSDLYTRNLVDHYAGHPAIADWLRDHWEHEELQHGRAFAAYVQAAWPEFPGRPRSTASSPSTAPCALPRRWKTTARWSWPRAAWSKPAPPATTRPCAG